NKGSRRSGRDTRRRRDRVGHRGRRGHHDHVDADLADRTVRPAPAEGELMKVSGAATLHAPIDEVWKALNDPAVLVRTIPGCERLEPTGPDSYRMVVTAGVASIKGTYSGQVALTDQQEPHSFLMIASGGGGQRMLVGVAKKMAGEFFGAVDDVLTGKAAPPAPVQVGAEGAAPAYVAA